RSLLHRIHQCQKIVMIVSVLAQCGIMILPSIFQLLPQIKLLDVLQALFHHKRIKRSLTVLEASLDAHLLQASAGTSTCSLACVASFPLQCVQPRQRNSDSESRFPPSPSDPCQSADLRRAALLRSLQMRAQPPATPSFEMSVDNISEQGHDIEESEYSFGSAHGIFSAQAIRGSGRVRSLLLDDSTLSPSVSMPDLSTPSEHEGNITGISCTNEPNLFSNMNCKTETNTTDLAPKEKEHDVHQTCLK
ncbi:hypothetical protein KI387_042742, partial [Taxus chinensis]